MIKNIYKATSHQLADKGWVQIASHFKETGTPMCQSFGKLVSCDDIIVQPAGRGFGMHSHSNMEIVTILFSGLLAHEGGIGRNVQLTPISVQAISSGTGVLHNEYNPSDDEHAHLIQLWFQPDQQNVMPTYEYKNIRPQDILNRWCLLVNEHQKEDSLSINQAVSISLAVLTEDTVYVRHNDSNGIYIIVIEGEIGIADEQLTAKDAIALHAYPSLALTVTETAKVLVVETPVY